MDFLSNLIKRPKSVLKDKAAISVDVQGDLRPVSDEPEDNGGGDRLLQSDSPAEKETTKKTAHGHVDVLLPESGAGGDNCAVKGPEKEEGAYSHDGGGDGSDAEGSPQAQLMNRSYGSSSTSSSANSSAIEEMLVQINDSLDQAYLDSDGEPPAPSGGTFVPVGTYSRAISGLSPLNTTKIIAGEVGGKHSPTSCPTLSVATSATGSSPTFRPNPFEVNTAMDKFPGELDLLDDVHCSGFNKTPNRFAGLTEFDEANIPELPPGLNPNIEDELDEFKMLLGPEPTDTALSSDNETFTDCQSYRDINAGEISLEVDAYRSAVNSHDAITPTGSAQEKYLLDATMESIDDLAADEAPVYFAIDEAALSKPAAVLMQQKPMLDIATFEDEPMDVDMNSTIDFECNGVAPIAVFERSEDLTALQSKPTQAINLSGRGAVLGGTQCGGGSPQHEGSLIQMQQSKHELNRSVELPTNRSLNILSAECGLQDNSVDSATDADNLSAVTIVEVTMPPTDDLPAAMSPQILSTSAERASAEVSSSSAVSTAPRVAPGIDMKLNLTLDMTSSVGSTKSSGPTSPGFPIKPPADTKHFPRSPTACAERKMSFLEKSEYAEREAADTAAAGGHIRKVTAIGIRVIQATPPKDVQPPHETKESFTEQHERSISPVLDKASAVLNGTFVDTPTEKADLSSKDRRTFHVTPPPVQTDANGQVEDEVNLSRGHASRLTFNKESQEAISNVANGPEEDAVNLNISSGSTRRTFNVLDEAAISPIDCTAAMDLGVSMPTPAPPFSPPIPTVQARQAEDFNKVSTLNGPIGQMEDAPHLNISSGSTRRTFNVLDEAALSPNDCAAPVDVGVSMPTPALPFSPPIPTLQARQAVASSLSQPLSPPIPTMQKRPVRQSPPIPTVQKRQLAGMQVRQMEQPFPIESISSQSPPPPTIQKRQLGQAIEQSPPIPTMMKRQPNAAAQSERSPPLLPTVQKRPSIHSAAGPSTSWAASSVELLSAKEQTQSNAMDEKDIFVDKFVATPLDDMFAGPAVPREFAEFGGNAAAGNDFADDFTEADFQSGTNLILNPSDFDFLLAKGNSGVQVDRSSLLLRFDPLVGVPVPIYQPQQQQQQLQQLLGLNSGALITTIEEEEHNNQQLVEDQQAEQQKLKQLEAAQPKKHARMSVDVIKDMNIDNDCNKAFENSNSQTDEDKSNFPMDELEKKIKNEVLKTEDIEKKLKDAEQREEAMIKRITEKDKTISKMNGVIESYEKTIAELVREKEQLIQNYEMQLAEVKTDRDSNYHHLTSLETTFSDLHVKYEKSKEMTSLLKTSEETLLTEKRQILENLRLQEQRYEKMKNHAMQQLEIANRKLESQTKEHAIESTKLKALLKKEEISRASLNEQLQQKSRENAELVKICDELISGQGS